MPPTTQTEQGVWEATEAEQQWIGRRFPQQQQRQQQRRLWREQQQSWAGPTSHTQNLGLAMVLNTWPCQWDFHFRRSRARMWNRQQGVSVLSYPPAYYDRESVLFLDNIAWIYQGRLSIVIDMIVSRRSACWLSCFCFTNSILPGLLHSCPVAFREPSR